MNVGELFVSLGLDSKGFDSGLDQAKKKSLSLGEILKNAFSFATGMAVWDAVKTGIQNSIGAGIQFNATMQQSKIAFDTMLGSAQKADALLQQLADFAAKTPFEFPELVDASKKLLAMGFSAQEVMPMLKSVGDAAAGLGLSGAEGVQRLIIALGQMRAKGKVSAEEMMQLTEAGVPAWDILAKAMGKSTAEVMNLSSKGLIPADKAIQALVTGMEQRFPNMMDKQSQSFNGLMSTLKDNLNMTFGQVMKPAFEWLANTALPTVVTGISKFSDVLQNGGSIVDAFRASIKAMLPEDIANAILNVTDKITGLGLAIKGLITGDESSIWTGLTDWMGISADTASTLTDALTSVHDGIANVFSWILNNGPTVKTVIAGIVGGIAAYKAAVIAANAVSAISNALMITKALVTGGATAAQTALAAATGNVTIAQKLLNAAMAANPIGIVVALIAGLVTALIYLWNTNEGFRTAVINIWTAVSSFLVSVAETIKGVWNGIVTFFQGLWNSLVSFFSQWGPTILAIIAPFIGVPLLIYQNWDQISAFMQTIWNGVVTFLTGIWNGIVTVAATIWTTLKTVVIAIVQGFVNAIVGFFKWLYNHNYYFKALVDFIVNAFRWLQTTAIAIWNAITSFLTAAWNKIKSIAATIWTAISAFFTTIWNGIKSVAASVWNAIVSFLSGVWNGIKNTASTIWNAIKNAITSLFNSAKSGVTTTANSIWSVISSVWNKIVSTITSVGSRIWNAIISPFNTAKNLVSNIIRDALNWGKNLIGNIVSGITSMIGKVTSAVKNVASTISRFLGFHSPAEAGPGKYADEWMPNLMNMLNEGIQKSIPNLQASLETALSIPILATQQIEPSVNLSDMATPQSLSQQLQRIIIEVPVYLDGSKFAHVTAKYTDEELYKIARKKGRALGHVSI